MTRDFHLPGRSPVIAGNGMAATSHPLATLTAVDVLRAEHCEIESIIHTASTLEEIFIKTVEGKS